MARHLWTGPGTGPAARRAMVLLTVLLLIAWAHPAPSKPLSDIDGLISVLLSKYALAVIALAAWGLAVKSKAMGCFVAGLAMGCSLTTFFLFHLTGGFCYAIGPLHVEVYDLCWLCVLVPAAVWLLLHREHAAGVFGGSNAVAIRWTALVMFVATAIGYLSNTNFHHWGDTVATPLLTKRIVHHMDFDLTDLFARRASDVPYAVIEVAGRYRAKTPLGPALLAAPVHVLYDFATDGVHLRGGDTRVGRVTAALAAAGSVSLLFLALISAGLGPRNAVLVALVYAFGTSNWSTSSQAIWAHGPSCLFNSMALWFLARASKIGTRSASLAGAGLAAAMALVSRPINYISLIVLCLYTGSRYGLRAAWPFFAAAMPLVATHVAYHLYCYGHLAGGYRYCANVESWSGTTGAMLAGLLMSPSRGLFIFSPVLLFAFGGAVRAIRERDGFRISCLAVIAGDLLALSRFSPWVIGWSYGPRYLTDALPFVTLLLSVPKRPLWKGPFLILSAVSVGIHAVGVYYPADVLKWHGVPNFSAFSERLWFWKDFEFLCPFRNRPLWLPATFHCATLDGGPSAAWSPELPDPTGSDRRDPASSYGIVRYADENEHEAGTLARTPSMRLSPGEYEASLSGLARHETQGTTVATLRAVSVTDDMLDPLASIPLARTDGRHVWKLPFRVDQPVRVSLEVVFAAHGSVVADSIRLAKRR